MTLTSPQAWSVSAAPAAVRASTDKHRNGDTVELFALWQQDGDRRARDELVQRFLPLARKLAARYRGRAGEPFDDLLQVASLALVKAIDRFDTRRGTAFSSFAVPTIVGELKRYFRDSGWAVHVPRGAQEFALRVQEAERALSASTGRSPTVQELAEYLEVSIEEAVDGLQAAAAHHSASLDAPQGERDGESRTLVDLLGMDDHLLELVDAKLTTQAAATSLSDRDREVLRCASIRI
jgi:RNA polymerase sigma-B factor